MKKYPFWRILALFLTVILAAMGTGSPAMAEETYKIYSPDAPNARVPAIKPQALGTAAPRTVGRIQGTDRYQTAVEISIATRETAKTVILANGVNFPDALAGSPLSGVYDAPVLLIPGTNVPDYVLAEIQRLGATDVIILGGEAAVSADVEAQLAGFNVRRIAEDSRYNTALSIGDDVITNTGNTKAFLTSGLNFPDALSISSHAAIEKIPIVFSKPDNIQDETIQRMQSWGITEITIIGGLQAISSNVEQRLADSGFAVSRIGGSDRSETAVNVAKEYLASTPTAVIATGQNFPDALAGGPYAAKQVSPILLVNTDKVPTSVTDYLETAGINDLTILGGTSAVSSSVEAELTNAAPLSTTYVTTSSVNFRTGPATTYPILETLSAGTVVEVISIENNWAKASYNGMDGYISADYLVPFGSKPRIGVSWLSETTNSYNYTVAAIEKAGGIPISLPQVYDQAGAETALNNVEGMVFVGGEDVDPSYYGQDFISTYPSNDRLGIDPDRDISDLSYAKAVIQLDKPAMGICRGAQVINVAAGGTLIQDIPSQLSSEITHRDPNQTKMVYHTIAIDSGSLLAEALGTTSTSVNSWHHQAVEEPGTNVTPIAHTNDGVVEAYIIQNRTFILGLQFHPENHINKGDTIHLEIFKKLMNVAVTASSKQ